MERRHYLRAAGAGAALALAGCLDVGGSGGGSGDGAGTPIADHEAATDLEAQPRLGSLGGNVVLAFEDPSCTTCRRFHENTFPRIRENLIGDEGAYVLRNFPVVYEWGGPATRALEATFDRSAEAHWALVDHYFGTQSEFGSDDVLDRTAAFLDAETEVDGGAVAEAVRAGEYDGAVEADVAAAEAAGYSEITPTIVLFRDGEYVTRTQGSVGYDAVARALGER